MKRFFLNVAGILLFAGAANGQTVGGANDFTPLPKPKAEEAVATFGGGCFWSMSEAMYELKGVNRVISGYAGGTTKNPTYDQVATQTTGHAECSQIYYDPKVISFTTLANAFFFAHDPTELNRQGPDEGTDYRSVAFYRTPAEKNILLGLKKKINQTKHYPKAIVTQVVPFTTFYAAENYHQDYYRLNGDKRYIVQVSKPKVMKFRKVMNAELKPEFQK
ncbi:peptide-methionine (S)-S-oxide reductase MsrA [Mucilaginibacter dorajii]|uniref:Peptide methionine sulfoxide reductase MsrA n=1 Tax=Mucilaginibacter dorajii TaxID=692994 RepID=A0ABP7PP62_9SPHI|nr:peptide-methionine (S)-S-oxide reductase MsrA [Mucilaginibacter dorajii]MCS3736296.1 peptide-methionine (S)-S-oxide reductase [Mucilaginibacter dorajii]